MWVQVGVEYGRFGTSEIGSRRWTFVFWLLWVTLKEVENGTVEEVEPSNDVSFWT